VKQDDSNHAIMQLRFDTIKRLKERIVAIQRAKESKGEPPAKEIPE
jgi:hypothetical protein